MKSNIIENQKRKITMKNNIESAFRNTLLYLIYYPFVLPIEKITKYIEDKRNNYWMNNEDKLKKAMLQEIAVYIASYVIRAENIKNGFQTFLIYNSYENDDTNFGNAMHLKSFVNFSFYTSHKNTKTRLYYENEKRKYGDNWSEDKFYDGLMKYLKNELNKMFKSETVKIEKENKYGNEYEYIIIKR